MNARSYILYLAAACFTACAGEVANDKHANTGKIKEHLVNANKIFVENESSQIDLYQERHQLDMELTGTGLRYHIFGAGTNALNPLPGDTVSVNYKVFLLDGTLCYDTQLIPVDFTVGKAEMPRGMDEAIQMMHVGDSAIIILPAHLAYGFTGDGDKIPGNSATIYYLSLIRLAKSQN